MAKSTAATGTRNEIKAYQWQRNVMAAWHLAASAASYHQLRQAVNQRNIKSIKS